MISNGRVVIIRTGDPSSRNERARIRIGRTFVKALITRRSRVQIPPPPPR